MVGNIAILFMVNFSTGFDLFSPEWHKKGVCDQEIAFLVRVKFFFFTEFDPFSSKWRKHGVRDQEMAFLVRVDFFLNRIKPLFAKTV